MGLEPESNNIQYPSSISADGTHFVFDEQMRGDSTIYMVPLRGERRVTSLIATMFDERNSQLSGDDRWIACQSNESGRDEVYVRPFPGVDGGRSQVSTGGGRQPLWAPNSRELSDVDPDGRIVAVPIQLSPGFSAGSPRAIVDRPLVLGLTGIPGRMYDVSRDGQRFLIIKAGGDGDQPAPSPQIVVVQNWFQELKRLAPTN